MWRYFIKNTFPGLLFVFVSSAFADGDILNLQTVSGEGSAGSLKTIGAYPVEHDRQGRVGRQGHTVTLLQNGHAFVYGAVPNGAVKNGSIILDRRQRAGVVTQEPPAIAWNAELQAWKAHGRPPECQYTRFLHSATLLSNNRILFSGGICDSPLPVNGDTSYPAAFTQQSIWNDVTQKWESAPSLSGVRIYHTATLLADGNVLIAGGESDTRNTDTVEPVLDSVEIYQEDVASKTAKVSQLPHLHFARAKHTATQLGDDSVLVAGGMDKDGKAVASVEIWNPRKRIWRDGPDLGIPRFNHTATLLSDGRLMIVGGIDRDGNPTRSVEIFDTAKNSWVESAPLLQSLRTHSATLLRNGDVLLTGSGFNDSGYTVSKAMVWKHDSAQWRFAGKLSPDGLSDIRDTEIYNLLPGKDDSALVFGHSVIMQWLPDISGESEYFPDSGRVGYATAVLNDGKILFAGGKAGNMSSDLAEIYDPLTNRYTLTGNMNQPRYTGMPFQASLTSVVLNDGRVVIAGGWVTGHEKTGAAVSNYAEVWNPSTGHWSVIRELQFGAQEKVYLNKLDDGRVIFFTSRDLAEEGAAAYRALIWNPRNNSVKQHLVTARARVKAAIALLTDGRVLIVGGSAREFVPEYICPKTSPKMHVLRERDSAAADNGNEEGDGCRDEPAHWMLQGNSSAEIWDSRTGTTSALDYPLNWHAENPQTLLLKDGNVVLVNSVMPRPQQGAQPQSAWLWNAQSRRWSQLPPLSTNLNWPMTELSDGSLIAWAASNINPTHANILKPGAASWEPMLRFPQNQATVTQLPSGQLLAFSSEAPYVALFDEKSQQWQLQLNYYLKSDRPSLVELSDGRVALLGSILGSKKFAQIWNPKNNSWISSGKVVEGNSTGIAQRLPSGAVMHISYGKKGSYVCDIWQPDEDSWTFCGTFNPENKSSYSKFVLGSLGDGRVVFMGSADTAFVFNESSHDWTSMKVEWNLEKYIHGIAVHADKPFAQFLDPASNELLDAGVVGGKYYSKPHNQRVPDSMLWDPRRKHWAYISFIMGNNGYWLPDGCAISGPPFKIYNPLTGKVVEYPGLRAAWMRQDGMTVLSDGTVVVAGNDATGPKFFHRKASCDGFEVLAEDKILMPGILDTSKAAAASILDSEKSPDQNAGLSWREKIVGWYDDYKLIALALLIPLLLYYAIKFSRNWLAKKYANNALVKPLSPIKGGQIISLLIRLLVYPALAIIIIPILWNYAHVKLEDKNNTPQAKALPCRYIGIWSQPFRGMSNRVTLKDNGQYIYEPVGSHLSEYAEPLKGYWSVEGENMIWYSRFEGEKPDVNKILEKSERSFTLLEKTGDHSRFELIESVKSDTCVADK